MFVAFTLRATGDAEQAFGKMWTGELIETKAIRKEIRVARVAYVQHIPGDRFVYERNQ